MKTNEIDDKAFEAMLATARESGAAAGRDAAGWMIQDLWGGRQTRPAAALRNARAVVDDVCECADRLGWQVPNLSGEWADGPTIGGLAAEVGMDDYDDVDADVYSDAMNDLCTAWEDAASEAMLGALEESAREYLANDDDAAE